MSFDPSGPINPFEAPRAEIRAGAGDYDQDDMAGYEQTRRAYLNHEASVKALGTLQYLNAFGSLVFMIIFFSAAAGLVTGMGDQPGLTPQMMQVVNVVVGGVFLVAFLLYAGFGYGLRNLQVWARWVMIALTSLGLLAMVLQIVVTAALDQTAAAGVLVVSSFPSLIIGYFLYLVASAKGAVVFSREYKEVIRRTPHIKYRMSIIVKVLLVILIAVIFMGLMAFLFAPRS